VKESRMRVVEERTEQGRERDCLSNDRQRTEYSEGDRHAEGTLHQG
jgi:hypothetical protein